MASTDFEVTYPCFAPVHPNGNLHTLNAEGLDCVCLFTDEDTLQKYLKEKTPNEIWQRKNIPDSQALSQFLRALDNGELAIDRYVGHITFDPAPGKRIQIRETRELLDHLDWIVVTPEERPLPVLISMLMCSDVSNDGPMMKTLKNVLFKLAPSKYPFTCKATVFLCLTEVYEGTVLQIEMVDADTEERVLWNDDTSYILAATPPLSVLEYVVPLPTFGCPHPGRYLLMALCDGVAVAEIPFRAYPSEWIVK